MRGYLPFIQKVSIHVHGLAVYVKGGLPFAQNLSLENSADCYLCFRLALLRSVLLVFPLLITFFIIMELIDLVNSDISNDLIQIINIPTWIPDCNCHSHAFLIYAFLLFHGRSQVSGQTSLISTIFSSLCCCRSLWKSLFSFVPTE